MKIYYSWSEITSKPTIPSVGNGTITITQNGTSKGSFTVNQSGNTTIALTDNNTTYGVVTTSSNGLMSYSDKSKLDSMIPSECVEVILKSTVENLYSYEGVCYRMGHIVCCNIAIKYYQSANVSHGAKFLSGFPAPQGFVIVLGQHWANGASSQPTSVRFVITSDGYLQSYYPGANEVINNSQPLFLNFSYIAKSMS